MKILKFIFAFLLTVAMLYIARTNSKGQPEFYSANENGYSFEYNSVPKGFENKPANIPITIKGDFSSGQSVQFRRSETKTTTADELKNYSSTPMTADPQTADKYSIDFSSGNKGARFYYYFEVVDSTGSQLTALTDEEQTPFIFKYIGHVPIYVLVSHLLFIFGTVFFIALATVESVLFLSGKSDSIKPVAKHILYAALLCFIGGYPVGFAMNWFAFGGLWEGVPFGTDATDNKTQLLFVYILFALFSMLGSLRGKPEKDIFSKKTLAWLGILSFVVMLFIYLIPHSIQFSKALTYSVCYSYIGFFALVYLVGYFRHKSKA